MQPYFFPYIGYFQLINSVDEFVIYDNIQYTKSGWINRNRILNSKGEPQFLTLPLKKDSDYLNVCERLVSSDYDPKKTLNMIRSVYSKAPLFKTVYALLEKCFLQSEKNLFEYLFFCLKHIKDYLEIDTMITVSSTIGIDHSLKSSDKVIAICKKLNTDIYVNAIGGQELYDTEEFRKHNLILKFIIDSDKVTYNQFGEFISHLSIIDVMMFNEVSTIKKYLQSYKLI